jgi:hypothetical protein
VSNDWAADGLHVLQTKAVVAAANARSAAELLQVQQDIVTGAQRLEAACRERGVTGATWAAVVEYRTAAEAALARLTQTAATRVYGHLRVLPDAAEGRPAPATIVPTEALIAEWLTGLANADRLARILWRRYGPGGLSGAAIAVELGVSRTVIWDQEHRGLRALRDPDRQARYGLRAQLAHWPSLARAVYGPPREG